MDMVQVISVHTNSTDSDVGAKLHCGLFFFECCRMSERHTNKSGSPVLCVRITEVTEEKERFKLLKDIIGNSYIHYLGGVRSESNE